jgi:hypothetical protein
MSKEHVYTFATSSEAWDFMHTCHETGLMAGYPSLKAPYTVRVLRKPLGSSGGVFDYHKAKIAAQNARMPKAMRDVMSPLRKR